MEEEHHLLGHILDRSMKPTDLPLSLLRNITGNFSEEQKIGEGGFAMVYKGVIRNRKVAVKRIRNNKTFDETLFRQEVNSLMKVNHQNIVQFLGFCSNTEHKAMEYKGEYIYAEDRERILCFEYVNNGSLEKYITDELRGLEWNTRYNIIKGICDGLEYLHMKKHIIHMDLKPANILLDSHMVAKITDFGLARMDERSHTTNRILTLGYCAPEYLLGGKMSVKSDVYSLGVIIIELVMGCKGIPDINNVLRRWRHRWGKSAKGTPFRYQQIAKLIEIGVRCQENDPYKRPFISEIIRDINEMESKDKQISNANECIVKQLSPYLEDDMLGIEPLELFIPFEINKQLSCTLELTNETNAYIAFNIQTTSPLPYNIQPNRDIVAPRSMYSVKITLQPMDKAPQYKQHTGDFVVRSTKVNGSLTPEDITEDVFNIEEGKMVDEVNLTVIHEPREPHVDYSLQSLTISDTVNLNSLETSDVPAESECKQQGVVSPDCSTDYSSCGDSESQSNHEDEEEEEENQRWLMLRGAIGDGPPDSLHDWTREGGHWRLAICHNGLDIFEELPNVDYVARSCGRAMKAVCVVEASCEAIFQLVMSMDTTRFKMETNMSLSRIHDRCLLILLLQLIILNEYLWFLWPRDLCYLRYWRRNDDGTYVVLFQSREHPNCGPQPGFVRAHIEKGGFQISPLNSRNGRSRTQVQHLMQIDLKGWSAGFLPSFRKDCLLHMLNYVAGLREFLSRSDGLQLI